MWIRERAKRALDAEWEKVRFLKRANPVKGLGGLDEACVTDADEVRSRARQMGEAVHVGRICELCHEKGSELEDGDPGKKIKGRSVLLGDNVKAQHFNKPEFC